jgi:hypothetical protein
MVEISKKDLYQALQQIPHKEIRVIGKFQFLVFPYVILMLKVVM